MSGLSKSTTDEEFRKAFENFGEIETSYIVKDQISKQSREFGFIKFSSKDSVEEAIREMNQTTLNGKEIRVEVSRRTEIRRNHIGRYMGGPRYPRESERGEYDNRSRRER